MDRTRAGRDDGERAVIDRPLSAYIHAEERSVTIQCNYERWLVFSPFWEVHCTLSSIRTLAVSPPRILVRCACRSLPFAALRRKSRFNIRRLGSFWAACHRILHQKGAEPGCKGCWAGSTRVVGQGSAGGLVVERDHTNVPRGLWR